MNATRIRQWLPVALAMVLASPAVAQDHASTAISSDAADFRSPADWSAPNAYHQALARMVGSWDVRVTSWLYPGVEPERVHAEAVMTSTMGERYVDEELAGTRGGRPFEAHGVTGFNNITGEVESTWYDNQSTAMVRSTGSLTIPGDEFVLQGTSVDPQTRRVTDTRTEVRFVSGDEFVVKDFLVRDGHDVKVMERIYSRK